MRATDITIEAARLAREFRRGKWVGAVQVLPDLLERVMQAEVAEPQALPGLVAAMLQCQERGDWLGMADYLSQELPALLQSRKVA